MVLTEIGARISKALHHVTNATVIDHTVIDELLKEICNTLVQADVNVKLVITLKQNLKKALDVEKMAVGHNKRNLIKKAVFDALCDLLDPGHQAYKLVRGKPNVVVFVGLQGNGKTTTIGKYAHYYKRKGFKPALVCADTFRAGAFDQLLQLASSTKVAFYGSRTERDPVKIAHDGVLKLKNDPEGFDLIIVDTSGRHKQENALFDEMQQIVEGIQPDQIVFVMDGAMGQAAYDQADAFRKAVKVGAVIVTKLDGHAKGGGALAAVAATQSPIIFLGTGEHMENLEAFDPESFVSKLLGWGDWRGVMDAVKTSASMMDKDKMEEMAQRMQQGKFTYHDLYTQYETMLNMGSMSSLMSMFPGMSSGQDQADITKNIKNFIIVMDSMTPQELNESKLLAQSESRMLRIAKGAGKSLALVRELINQHKYFEKMIQGIGKQGKLGAKGGKMNAMPAQLINAIPPDMLKKMGGANNLNQMMKQFQSGMN